MRADALPVIPELTWVDTEPVDRPGRRVLADLAEEVPVLDGWQTCEDLDRVFRRDSDLSCAVVTHPVLGDVHGTVERTAFEAMMSGPYGYGRSLFARRPLTDVARWDALTLTFATGVTEAASRAITREPAHVQDHVLVRGDGRIAVVAMPVLLAALARSLAERALRDPLTGLANRDAFFGRVQESCRRTATQHGHQTAVVYLDLDGFKAVNDDLGHDAGDALLTQVAAALGAAARPGDLVARLGGDEFAVCLDLDGGPGDDRDPDPTLARAVAERLYKSVARAVPAAPGLAVSVGVALCATSGVDAGELVRAADLAMYTGKRDGGDTVTGPVVVTAAHEADPLLGTSVAEAAARGELLLHFQPIVDMRDDRLVSLEALVRWQHPRLGLLSPGSFLPSVERAGQLPALDAWVMRAATQEFGRWRDTEATDDQRERVFLNVNVSSARLLGPGLCAEVLSACAAAGLDARRVRVEVSETLLVNQLQAASGPLQELREAGIAVTFDDMGAGGTTFRHLREVRADGLKIDRSYVQGMLTSALDRALVQALVDFGASTGVTVTAEGVETAEQRDALLELGCRYGQGYLFARPAPLRRPVLGAVPAAG